MDIILSHNNLDCDGLAAIVAMSRLRPQATPVLIGSLNRNVRELLARFEGSVHPARLRDLGKQPLERIILVDAQTLPSDESLQRRLEQSKPLIEVYDHHPLADNGVAAASMKREDTGATTTILAEEMQAAGLVPSPADATLMMLGIYEDTGHLTYHTTTVRDVRAAAWLLQHGADLEIVAEYIDRPLSARQMELYQVLLSSVTVEQISGYAVLLAQARLPDYVEEVSTLAHKLVDQYDPDAAFILVQMQDIVQVIARSRNAAIDVSAIIKPLGGGGHAPAAAALVRGRDLEDVRAELWVALRQGLAPAIVAADIMTRELHWVPAGATIAEANAALRRYGHEVLPILDSGRLAGLIMRRDADKAMHHGLGDRPVEAFATFDMPTVSPRSSFLEIQEIMQSNNTGQIPVLDDGRLVGIVTRTDVIRYWSGRHSGGNEGVVNLAARVHTAIEPDVLSLLTIAGKTATAMGYSLYLVGGFVRDLLLKQPSTDLDLVVEGDAIALAGRLADEYGGRTVSHTRFGTAKWRVAPGEARPDITRPLALDLVTARTEFYEHPAALPIVEAGSLRHDLYRRDFTINTMAICLNGPRYGKLLDFYGGKADLDNRLIRVLHNLSFVDDATRILRAARLADRLNFQIEERTAALILNAWDSLDHVSGDRLRHELRLILDEAEPERIIRRLDELGVLRRLHPRLGHAPWLDDRFAAVRAALPTWRAWGWGDGGSGGDARTAQMAAYLALLAYPLSFEELGRFMERLNIAAEAGNVLRQVWRLRSHLAELSGDLRPSQIYHLLQPFLIEAIVVVYIAEESIALRQAIVSYIERLRHVRTEVDGLTLKALGIPPGPLYSELLQAVLDAKLDGEVADRAGEERLLAEQLVVMKTRQ